MLSYFFKPNKPKVDDLESVSLRSFYKYSYKDHEVILIGEAHVNTNVMLAQQYINVFQEFFKKNLTAQLFVEGYEGDEVKDAKAPLESSSSAISCINKVAFANKVKIIRSDQRSDEAFLGFYKFMRRLYEGLAIIKKTQVEQKIADWNPLIFDDPEFLPALREFTTNLNIDFNLMLFYKLLVDAVGIVSELDEQYSVEYPELGDYMNECFFKLVSANNKLDKLDKEYRTLGYEEKQILDKPLFELCIEQIKHAKNFESFYKLWKPLDLYIQYFYDATLVTDIWSRINKDDTQKTIIVAAGDAHISRLADLLDQVANPIVSFNVQKGNNLSPKDIMTHLGLVKPPEEKRRECCLMM